MIHLIFLLYGGAAHTVLKGIGDTMASAGFCLHWCEVHHPWRGPKGLCDIHSHRHKLRAYCVPDVSQDAGDKGRTGETASLPWLSASGAPAKGQTWMAV